MKTDWNNPDDVRKYYREYARRYRELHPDSSKQSNYKQYWKNPEAHRIRSNLQRKKMGTFIRLMYQRFLYLFGRESIRENWRRYYRRSKPYHLERAKIWTRNNREAVRRRNRNRKFLTKTVDGESCIEKLKLLSLDCFCHWCCVRLTPDNRSVDHVIPISRGGRHIPDNLVSACKSCNSSKCDKLVSEWTWSTA